MTAISSPLKWHGGKSYLAKKIVALMPPHIHYVEPYAGGLSVLLAKDPEGVSEVVNDLHGELTNFWEVLQSSKWFESFRRRIEATPFSEEEYRKSQYIQVESYTPVERAVKFFIHCRQSLAGRIDGFAPLSKNRTRRGMNEQVSAWLSTVEALPFVHDRLKRVVILNRSALEVIRSEDSKNTLFYLDPPYLPSARAAKEVYQYEMSAADHGDLLEVCVNAKGKVMLSGYPSEFYDCHLEGWRKVVFDLPNNSASGVTKRRMQEVIWMNF